MLLLFVYDMSDAGLLYVTRKYLVYAHKNIRPAVTY